MARGSGCESGAGAAQPRGCASDPLYQGELPQIVEPWNAPSGYSVCRQPNGRLLLIVRRVYAQDGDGRDLHSEWRAVFDDETELRQALARHEARTPVDDAALDALVLAHVRAHGPEIAMSAERWLHDHGYLAGDTRKSGSRVGRSLQRLKAAGLVRWAVNGPHWAAVEGEPLASAPETDAAELAVRFELRYHVPRSQVWGGSRGAQRGNVHLHVREDFDQGRIHRRRGDALCGKSGWYERETDTEHERSLASMCPRCVEIASRPSR